MQRTSHGQNATYIQLPTSTQIHYQLNITRQQNITLTLQIHTFCFHFYKATHLSASSFQANSIWAMLAVTRQTKYSDTSAAAACRLQTDAAAAAITSIYVTHRGGHASAEVKLLMFLASTAYKHLTVNFVLPKHKLQTSEIINSSEACPPRWHRVSEVNTGPHFTPKCNYITF